MIRSALPRSGFSIDSFCFCSIGGEMSEAPAGRYWCHACGRMVNPVAEPELKCPLCDDGFVEEMESGGLNDSASDPSLALWAPILLEMLGGSARRPRSRRGPNLDREFENFVRRRRRGSAIVRLLQSLQDDLRSGIGNMEAGLERARERERENLILIDPFNQALLLQGSSDTNRNGGHEESINSGGVGASLGDYFIGPGLDILLQHLEDNDPSGYGTPPAKKEAIDALLTVKIEEAAAGCSICLEDFDIDMEAKEMPCRHKFHSGCILPWLELHSSCPVCRSQLPADESKFSNGSSDGASVERGARDHNGLWVPVPWPFNGLFSLSPSSQSRANSSWNAPSSSSSAASNSESSNSHCEN
ncbi:hypothetical protein ZIOFF_073404 [Zingiber officinale]|uniref:RING-type E3 ubiquitin transferase n=2 Tax=Zingiber officinale TaxID=94328 RepID=A0A8J5BX50_ZINOF|nr:hypothetical protein ZIOFF_073404 [Zingiber officinale]